MDQIKDTVAQLQVKDILSVDEQGDSITVYRSEDVPLEMSAQIFYDHVDQAVLDFMVPVERKPFADDRGGKSLVNPCSVDFYNYNADKTGNVDAGSLSFLPSGEMDILSGGEALQNILSPSKVIDVWAYDPALDSKPRTQAQSGDAAFALNFM